MEIYIAENSGFCKGVEYAVNTALSLEDKNAYILGEIIHNADVVKAISDKGLKVVESLEDVPDGSSVVFRSHGVPESYYGICERRNLRICKKNPENRCRTICTRQPYRYRGRTDAPRSNGVAGLVRRTGDDCKR